MRDFTPDTLHYLLSALISEGYTFMTVAGFLSHPVDKCVILRHDVDARPANSLKCAELEKKLGIAGTYYFRADPKSFDEDVIRDIHALGHEIGYHYEDLAVAHGDYDQAIGLFEQNLAKLRRLVPVETICMHGSPLSRYDNRKLWEKYDYRDFGITGEPYLDIDFREVLYLTDTGRRWDGDRYNVRDRVPVEPGARSEKQPGNGRKSRSIHSTFEIVDAARKQLLKPRVMITIHPQRWDNRLLPWLRELVFQNIRNVAKGLLRVAKD